MLDPVQVLVQRRDFLQGITNVARACNWPEDQIEELRSYLWFQIIKIDNYMYDVYEQTGNQRQACVVWTQRMEELRHWLGLVFGVRIKYI